MESIAPEIVEIAKAMILGTVVIAFAICITIVTIKRKD